MLCDSKPRSGRVCTLIPCVRAALSAPRRAPWPAADVRGLNENTKHHLFASTSEHNARVRTHATMLAKRAVAPLPLKEPTYALDQAPRCGPARNLCPPLDLRRVVRCALWCPRVIKVHKLAPSADTV